jgi:hypothetical protein
MAAKPNGKNENILTSWKEIAAYLDRDVRTCVRWEQRYGLPVHRLDRDSKGKVFAYRDQIDEWLASRAAHGASRPASALNRAAILRAFPLVFAVAGAAAAVYFLFLQPGNGSRPAGFDISGSRLLILNEKGRTLGPFDTRLKDLESAEFYREHYQEKAVGPGYEAVWPMVMIKDLDGDGRSEVLFSFQTRSEDGEGTLVCLDDKGVERWRFEAGRELTLASRAFRREYRVFGFDVEDYDGDGALEVLVVSIHKPDWPCQVALLDARGKLEGEYWNAGYLMEAKLGDVDGDGAKELVLGGVNNEYARGCVVVFEAGAMSGGSPQEDPGYRWLDVGPGSEAAYILFPKTDVHEAIRKAGDPVNYFWIHEGDGLTAVTVEAQVFYDLDRTLACRDVNLGNDFKNLHEKYRLEGKVRSVADDAYRKALGQAILYRQGDAWVSRPAPAPAGAINGGK